MRKRADPCPIFTSALKKGETKLFYIYYVFLSIKQLEKKDKILELKPALSRIKERS